MLIFLSLFFNQQNKEKKNFIFNSAVNACVLVLALKMHSRQGNDHGVISKLQSGPG